MEWKYLFAGLLIGALIALPLGIAHPGFGTAEKTDPRWEFGPGMMPHGYADGDMYGEMEEHVAEGNFTEVHEEMEQAMEEHMSAAWEERHEYCERVMGIEEDG